MRGRRGRRWATSSRGRGGRPSRSPNATRARLQRTDSNVSFSTNDSTTKRNASGMSSSSAGDDDDLNGPPTKLRRLSILGSRQATRQLDTASQGSDLDEEIDELQKPEEEINPSDEEAAESDGANDDGNEEDDEEEPADHAVQGKDIPSVGEQLTNGRAAEERSHQSEPPKRGGFANRRGKRRKGWNLRKANKILQGVPTQAAPLRLDEGEGKPRAGGILDRLPGRRRVPHADPQIEAFMRRQLELKVAYRAVVKQLKPVLAELGRRTIAELEEDSECHKQREEYEDILAMLDRRLETRLGVINHWQELEESRLAHEIEANQHILKDRYTQILHDLQDDHTLQAQHKFMEILRELEAQGDDEATEDEDDLIYAQYRIDPEYDERRLIPEEAKSRATYFVKIEQAFDELTTRRKLRDLLRQVDPEAFDLRPKDFAVYDGHLRRLANASWNLRQLIQAGEDIVAEEERRKALVVTNEQAVGLQALAQAVDKIPMRRPAAHVKDLHSPALAKQPKLEENNSTHALHHAGSVSPDKRANGSHSESRERSSSSSAYPPHPNPAYPPHPNPLRLSGTPQPVQAAPPAYEYGSAARPHHDPSPQHPGHPHVQQAFQAPPQHHQPAGQATTQINGFNLVREQQQRGMYHGPQQHPFIPPHHQPPPSQPPPSQPPMQAASSRRRNGPAPQATTPQPLPPGPPPVPPPGYRLQITTVGQAPTADAKESKRRRRPGPKPQYTGPQRPPGYMDQPWHPFAAPLAPPPGSPPGLSGREQAGPMDQRSPRDGAEAEEYRRRSGRGSPKSSLPTLRPAQSREEISHGPPPGPEPNSSAALHRREIPPLSDRERHMARVAEPGTSETMQPAPIPKYPAQMLNPMPPGLAYPKLNPFERSERPSAAYPQHPQAPHSPWLGTSSQPAADRPTQPGQHRPSLPRDKSGDGTPPTLQPSLMPHPGSQLGGYPPHPQRTPPFGHELTHGSGPHRHEPPGVSREGMRRSESYNSQYHPLPPPPSAPQPPQGPPNQLLPSLNAGPPPLRAAPPAGPFSHPGQRIDGGPTLLPAPKDSPRYQSQGPSPSHSRHISNASDSGMSPPSRPSVPHRPSDGPPPGHHGQYPSPHSLSASSVGRNSAPPGQAGASQRSATLPSPLTGSTAPASHGQQQQQQQQPYPGWPGFASGSQYSWRPGPPGPPGPPAQHRSSAPSGYPPHPGGQSTSQSRGGSTPRGREESRGRTGHGE